MRFDILSLFPEAFVSPFSVSIVRRAIERGIVEIGQVNIRDFAEDKHRKVDDRPYGGGPGMVLVPGPCVKAIRSVRKEDSRVVFLSPQGTPLNAKKCKELAENHSHLILLCGHYEGVDQRVIDAEVDEEISIGDFIMTSGCLPVMCLVDAIIRFIPGALGHEEAAASDSFQSGALEGPQYTRPEEFEGMRVPEVLMSGNHEKIESFRREKGLEKTRLARPDLTVGVDDDSVTTH